MCFDDFDIDLIAEHIHFFADDPPRSIAQKALRVNLSDLAAKGATPVGYLLSLALKEDWTEAWIAGFAAGLAAGWLNGFLISRLGIEAFIVTLGSMGIYRSLVTWLANGGTLSLDFGLRTFYQPVYYGGVLGVSWPIIVFAAVVILGEIAMRSTAFGRHCAAIGSNDQVAKYASVRVARVRLATYVALGLLVGVATIMYVPRLGSASASTGLLWELEAIAAVIIGGTALKGGFGRVWGTVIGVLILSLIGNLLNLTDFVSPYLNGAIQGAIIVLAVVLQREAKPGR